MIRAGGQFLPGGYALTSTLRTRRSGVIWTPDRKYGHAARYALSVDILRIALNRTLDDFARDCEAERWMRGSEDGLMRGWMGWAGPTDKVPRAELAPFLNLGRIRLFNAVNLEQGYGLIEIRTPREVLYEEDV